MHKNIVIIILMVLTTWLTYGCSNDKFKVADSGLKYKFEVKGDGETPENGSILLLNISYTNANDNVLFTSAGSSQGALALEYVDSLFSRKGGLEEGINMMQKGDSLILKFPIEDLYENTFNVPLPDSLERGSEVTVCIGASEIMTKDEHNVFLMAEYEKQQQKALDNEGIQFETDLKLIDDFLAAENLEAEIHESGLRFRITEEGTGAKPANGELVSVNYIGRLLDGTLFDTSVKEVAQAEGVYNMRREPYSPFTFSLGTGSVIQGWDIAIGLLNEGGKAEIYIPSSLGYGPRASGRVIGPNSVLVFEVELVKIGE